MMGLENPPRHGEGDHAKHGGGGSSSLRRSETYTARKLRQDMSLPEVLLWQRLRGNQLGVKFRRQHPIGSYIVDFYCNALRLAIEIDGEAHSMGNRPARDASRDAFLNENGYKVLRFPASDILRDMDGVVAAIVDGPLHHQPAAGGPPPRAGEDKR